MHAKCVLDCLSFIYCFIDFVSQIYIDQECSGGKSCYHTCTCGNPFVKLVIFLSNKGVA